MMPSRAQDNHTRSMAASSSKKRSLEQKNDEQNNLEFGNSIDTDLSGCFQKFIANSVDTAGSSSSTNWAPELLQECAKAVDEKDGPRVQYLMWVLNELSSPYGNTEQRLASAFLQALFAKLTRRGGQHYRSLCSAAAKSHSFASMKKMVLKFQELSPWMTVGMVAANGAILEALEGERSVHIVDVSNTFCTQWPTLFEALAMRAEHPPHLRVTTLRLSSREEEESSEQVMREITHRLEKFARLMGIPFEFSVLAAVETEEINPAMLETRSNEVLIVNAMNFFQHQRHGRPLAVLARAVNPKAVIVVEDEVDLSSPQFLTRFAEAQRFYSMFFESLDSSFPRTSGERMMLERVAGRRIVAALGCDDDPAAGARAPEKWNLAMQREAFVPKPLKSEVVDDIQALLKRYKPGWGLQRCDIGLFLTWKEENAIAVTVWKQQP
ncbi:hypothetical protein SELMODRAFT_412418 [Selaginella moellendorffii]|uniref:Uncharacterized protein SHR3-2 n=1 Tax=Selaginella moellendorffii TaxID=88036 RepID=D8RL33_SELML|nr:protein SHORT-ROOT [Selaginella moellendorffii]EFJ27336.1 hypothetical protein SELMODRAFT_412418 [Selaginella moellendorffii]|eukprot:XP_002971587.1 protein SHORT-ROOT [Selaginella moellendorffii]